VNERGTRFVFRISTGGPRRAALRSIDTYGTGRADVTSTIILASTNVSLA